MLESIIYIVLNVIIGIAVGIFIASRILIHYVVNYFYGGEMYFNEKDECFIEFDRPKDTYFEKKYIVFRMVRTHK